MHDRVHSRRRSPSGQGTSLIEVIIALVIIALSVYFAAWAFESRVKETASIRGSTVITQVENAVRQAVFDTLRTYFQGATVATPPCDISAPPRLLNALNQTLPSGITLTVLSDAAAFALTDNAPGDPAVARFNQALVRCQDSPLAYDPANPSNFSGLTGIYFCSQITAQGSSLDVAGSVSSMQPMFGEFFYTTIHASTFVHAGVPILFGQLTCSQLAGCLPPTNPPHGLLGELFYTFYWTPRVSGGKTAHKRASGLVVRGAG